MTSLNFVPISALSSRGVISGSMPVVAPMISSVLNSSCRGLHRRVGARHRQRHLAVDAAEEVELAEIEPDRRRIPVLDQQHAALDERDGGAVLGRDVEHVVGGGEAAGRRHVLHDDGGIAGDVPADMARHQPRLGVVAAARRRADDQRDLLAGVELGDRLGDAGGAASAQHRRHDERQPSASRRSL